LVGFSSSDVKVNMAELCGLCKEPLTPETRMTQFDLQQNMLIVCYNRGACSDRVHKAKRAAREEAERPQREEAERLIREFGHLPQDEQIQAMFKLRMDAFVDIQRTRGGVTYYILANGDRYCWDLFEKFWTKVH